MTLMLASVGDAREAEIVVGAGADIVDMKNPRAGAIGAVAIDAAREIATAVGGRRRLSATMGDPPYDAEALAARARALRAIGVDDFKLAVDSAMLDSLEGALGELTRDGAWIGMLFADQSPDFALLPRLAKLGFKGAMLDTADKSRGRLTTHLDAPAIAEFCARCRQLGLLSGLAGSLEAPDAPRLLMARPDVLGFRGALCEGRARAGAVDARATQLIRDLIPREAPIAPSAPNVDWRLMGRGLFAGGETSDEVDQIFVRDFVIPARIGAYDYERGVEQRVVFNVQADVRRVPAHSDDMRAIFSYDLILDAIRLVVGRGHGQFVETFAEEVAALTLEHPRVAAVRVRVEKLDVVNGAVGVEIRRERPRAAAAPVEAFTRARPRGA